MRQVLLRILVAEYCGCTALLSLPEVLSPVGHVEEDTCSCPPSFVLLWREAFGAEWRWQVLRLSLLVRWPFFSPPVCQGAVNYTPAVLAACSSCPAVHSRCPLAAHFHI